MTRHVSLRLEIMTMPQQANEEHGRPRTRQPGREEGSKIEISVPRSHEHHARYRAVVRNYHECPDRSNTVNPWEGSHTKPVSAATGKPILPFAAPHQGHRKQRSSERRRCMHVLHDGLLQNLSKPDLGNLQPDYANKTRKLAQPWPHIGKQL